MGFRYFRLNSLTFTIDGLEILFRDFIIARITHYYIIVIVCAALNSLIVGDAEGNTTGTERYFVI